MCESVLSPDSVRRRIGPDLDAGSGPWVSRGELPVALSDARNDHAHSGLVLQSSGIWRSEMASTARDIFLVGLRNAHAMEVQARELMERQSERLSDYPEVQAKAQTHLRETEGQLNRLEQCLSSMGENFSTLKDTTQSVMGNIMARPFDGRRRNP
jgi:hypothetical protein